MLKFHHVRFDKSAPGMGFAKEYANTEKSAYQLTVDKNLSKSKNMYEMPSAITPPGMSIEQQQYLYDKMKSTKVLTLGANGCGCVCKCARINQLARLSRYNVHGKSGKEDSQTLAVLPQGPSGCVAAWRSQVGLMNMHPRKYI